MIACDEIVVDLFAGGGGASTGIERALGRPVTIAVNHSATAIAMHVLNHPQTEHYTADVWDVDPARACRGRRVGLLWVSPSCTYFSKASGGQNLLCAKIRSLASVVIRWARDVKPRVIILENVEEFEDWGPLDNDRKPIKAKKGRSFKIWLGKLKAQGYHVEWRQLVAADYGAPTTRNRLYLVARRDGEPIVWPEPTHAPAGSLFGRPWRTAAECIDWSIGCPSIFMSEDEARVLRVKRPLADATLARIAAGLRRFVLEAKRPFIAPRSDGEIRLPFMVQTGYGERPAVGNRKAQKPRVLDLHAPLGAVVSTQKHALVTAFVSKAYGGPNGHSTPGSDLRDPLGSITAKDHNNLVAVALEPASSRPHSEQVRAFIAKYYGSNDTQVQSVNEPLHTITTKARFGLVLVEGVEHVITDIGMRMLDASELWRAQGFGDPIVEGITKTDQVKLCGNSVCPPVAEALVRANVVRANDNARRDVA